MDEGISCGSLVLPGRDMAGLMMVVERERPPLSQGSKAASAMLRSMRHPAFLFFRTDPRLFQHTSSTMLSPISRRPVKKLLSRVLFPSLSLLVIASLLAIALAVAVCLIPSSVPSSIKADRGDYGSVIGEHEHVRRRYRSWLASRRSELRKVEETK
jgi:hypothetical protein